MDERDVEYRRQKAEQFRRLAAERKTALSAKLLEIAAELEARASDIEVRLKPPNQAQ